MSSADKQIRELTPLIFAEVCDVCKSYYGMSVDEVLSKAVAFSVAMKVTELGYRKQSEGEWEIVKGSNGQEKMVCTNCRHGQDLHSTFTYCPNCGARMHGAKMKGV